ncbi:MAG: hypothetical protein ACRD1X_07510 [Vicinamibacteria bacterium]
MIPALLIVALCASLPASLASSSHRVEQSAVDGAPFLSWTRDQAIEIGKGTREDGRVGGWFDARVVHTEHSYNYKLRATWLTADVIRATARLQQLDLGLTNDETMALVEEAEIDGSTIIMVEIDPREGSGVLPRDWVAILRPTAVRDEVTTGARGVSRPEFRRVKALAGTHRRDYSYDLYWLVFPLLDEGAEPLFPAGTDEAELVVRIGGKEGRVRWKLPRSIRETSVSAMSERR